MIHLTKNNTTDGGALQPTVNENDLEFDVFHLFSVSFYQMKNKIHYLSILQIYSLLNNYFFILFLNAE